jgi:hypothetical protein
VVNFFQRDRNRGLSLVHADHSSNAARNPRNEHNEISADAKYIVKHLWIMFVVLSLMSLALHTW